MSGSGFGAPGSELGQVVLRQDLTNQLLGAIQQAVAALSSTWTAGLVTAIGSTLSLSADTLGVKALAQSQSSPADPTGIALAGGTVMMGLAGAITPLVTGKVLIVVSGTIFNSTGAAGDGCNIQLRHGTGAAPANGAAATGTAVGGLLHYVASTGAGKVPFSLNAFVSGLSLAAHWIDVTLAATTGGTANITDVSISAVELE